MSQFRSTGGLDDSIAADGDRGFFGVNQRLQLNQLEAGEVRESLNGRMEGYWKPRKNVSSLSGALTTDFKSLELPFLLLAGDSISITNAVASTNLVTITTGSAHGFSVGDFVSVLGLGYSAGPDPNGLFQITASATATSFAYALTSATGTYTFSGATTSRMGRTISSAVFTAASGGVDAFVTLTISGDAFGSNAIGTSGKAEVSGLIFTTTDLNGTRELEVITATTLKLTIPSTATVTGVALGTNPRVTQLLVDNAANANVRASCLFSDTNESNKEYVIIALDAKAQKIDLDDPSNPVDITYPSGSTVSANTDMIQAFDKVMLFRDGQQALEWYPNGRPILSASSDATASPNTVVTMNVREHGLVAGDSVIIAGLAGGSTRPNGTYVVASVSSQDVFTFKASGISTSTTFTTTAATITSGFTLSPGGAYTQPQTFLSSGGNVTVASGLVSLTVTGNLTILAGDIVVIYETTIPELTAIVGKQFQVTSASTTNIKFLAPVANISASGSTGQVEFGGRFTEGGGFMHQPGAPWATYFQRRLWVPYYYDQSGDYNAITYTNRKITDEIAVSDLLDTTTFDQIENQFRISGGTADYVVGMHGFYDDALVVLNRNSLHLISGTQGSLLDTKVTELTSEVGCLSRKSVVMRGNVMMFLSDDGVYGIEFLNDYNLRGADEPISKNIQPYIDRISKNYSDNAVGVLYENRYYLAVPLDSYAGANDARGNNSILIFNFLNKGWESLDTFGDSRFLIENFIIGSTGVRNNIYAVTSNGGLHQLESGESSNDFLNIDNSSTIVSPEISSVLVTRGYDFGTMERKRFTDAQINMQNLRGGNGEYEISFAAEDPDDSQFIGTTSTFLGGLLEPSNPNESETASIRCRLGGIRGFTGTMILTRSIGSPRINSVKVSGSVTNRQIISQK
jgi:hypothetical protein